MQHLAVRVACGSEIVDIKAYYAGSEVPITVNISGLTATLATRAPVPLTGKLQLVVSLKNGVCSLDVNVTREPPGQFNKSSFKTTSSRAGATTSNEWWISLIEHFTGIHEGASIATPENIARYSSSTDSEGRGGGPSFGLGDAIYAVLLALAVLLLLVSYRRGPRYV
ncbi:hypothetical protein Hbut_1152 [Hyperthermus butylicus DSM 5456]|uniref:Uncharacterized protein n=1 Tax=Hyperthermus butylicus (strain DSM 5456 / JCM 9403 / PLM1-5) TaxID=415426 RepID=A2BLX8_HYPBU|nr:hypothetical protein Hbut_1152 [Hyperthermus butylicus DSM 5456]